MSHRDFLLAAVLLMASNVLWCGAGDEHTPEGARVFSYRRTLGELRRMPATPPAELLVLGDSRTRQLDVDAVCAAMTPRPARCINASSTAGDWVTAWDLYRAAEPLLAADATIVLAVSDYWLEMGGRDALGLIPRSLAYARLGDPMTTVASYLPASRTRAARMQAVREALERAARSLQAALTDLPESPVPSDAPAGDVDLPHSNVDEWFRPTRETDRVAQLARASRLLDALQTGRHRVVLVYLPNPAVRDGYVDERYPGRRDRFFGALRQLAALHEVPVVDLSGRLPARRLYRDFHHLNRRGRKAIVPILARELDRAGSRAAAKPTG